MGTPANRKGCKLVIPQIKVEEVIEEVKDTRKEKINKALNIFKPSINEIEILTTAPMWWYDKDLTFIVQEYDELHYKVIEKTEKHLTHLIRKIDAKIIENEIHNNIADDG